MQTPTWHGPCSNTAMMCPRKMCAAALGFAAAIGPAAAEPAIGVSVDPGLIAGRPGAAVVTLEWPAAEAPAVVWAEPPAAVEWGTLELGALSVETAGGKVVYSQSLAAVAEQPGAYELPPIAFRYAAEARSFPAADDTAESEAGALTVVTAPATSLTVAADSRFPWPAVAALSVAAVAALICAKRALSRRPKTELAIAHAVTAHDAAPGPFDDALLDAKRARAEGDCYGFYKALIAAVAADAGLVERLKRKAEDVGFRHITPPPSELDGDLRDVERALARYKENTGA